MIDFVTGEKRKLKEQYKELLRKKKLILKLREEEMKKLTDPPTKSGLPDYIQKDKEYIKFEHELYGIINNLLEREDIKKVFTDYKEHLQLIYNI